MKRPMRNQSSQVAGNNDEQAQEGENSSQTCIEDLRFTLQGSEMAPAVL